MIRYVDRKNKFIEIFNKDTGFYMRSGIIENGKDTNVDPFMRNFPNLLDVGIMGHCRNSHLCTVGCYQGKMNKPNMPFKNFKSIIDQCKGKVFSCALGGSGSPNEHEEFENIVKYAKENDIIPNYTTSGIELTDEQAEITKKYCGAVAVSEYGQDYTYSAMQKFIDHGCKVNIHYVLGNDSIDSAIKKLRNNDFYKGINAVIFLTYKPSGCIKKNNVLKYEDPRVKKFYELIDKGDYDFKIGLDACHMPAVFNFLKNVNIDSTTSCDGASFSAYITPDFQMIPCSFDTITRKFAVDLDKYTIEDAWNSQQFENFRNYHRNSCSSCINKINCNGGCPLYNEINLCNRIEKNFVKE